MTTQEKLQINHTNKISQSEGSFSLLLPFTRTNLFIGTENGKATHFAMRTAGRKQLLHPSVDIKQVEDTGSNNKSTTMKFKFFYESFRLSRLGLM